MRFRGWLPLATVLLAAVLVWETATMTAGTRATWGIVVHQALSGQIGAGSWTGTPNTFDFSQLEPGDIVIGGNPGASWGHYTHAVLYVGNGQVLETALREGVALGPVSRYHDYTWVGALRIKASPEVRTKAVALARAELGRPFYLLAPRGEDNWFYCTKLVWWAYKQAGVDLNPNGGFWVVPDQFFQSALVQPLGRTQPPAGGKSA